MIYFWPDKEIEGFKTGVFSFKRTLPWQLSTWCNGYRLIQVHGTYYCIERILNVTIVFLVAIFKSKLTILLYMFFRCRGCVLEWRIFLPTKIGKKKCLYAVGKPLLSLCSRTFIRAFALNENFYRWCSSCIVGKIHITERSRHRPQKQICKWIVFFLLLLESLQVNN